LGSSSSRSSTNSPPALLARVSPRRGS
jgi:hypothetical protein